MANNTDLYQSTCLIPSRPVNNRFPTLEALQAEMWMWHYYRLYFKERYGDYNTYVITGLSYLTDDYRGNSAFKAI